MREAKLSEANEALRGALAIASSEPWRTVELLELALERARSRSDSRGVGLLARHAGVVCTGLNDLNRARRFFEVALGVDGQNAYLHLAYGDILRMLGERSSARPVFARALELANEQGIVDVIDMATQALTRLDGAPNGP